MAAMASLPPSASIASASAAGEQRIDRLVKNLAALFAADLTLARKLDAMADGELAELVATRSGEWTMAVADPTAEGGGRPLFLHSRHNPGDEAKRLVDAAGVDGKVAFTVYGMGLGYHVADLLERTTDETLVLVFEPNLATLRRALECVDLSKAVRQKRLCFILEPDKGALFNAVGGRTVLLAMSVGEINHGPSRRLAAEFFDACSKMVADHAAFSKTAINTVLINGKRTAENNTRNSVIYAAACGGTGGVTRLADRHKGVPAIVVSAGPSLKKNRHLLIEAQKYCIIVAVQTTLKPLLELGIEPDYVTSLDWSDISARFFEGLPSTLRTELVAEAKAAPIVLSMHPGPISVVGCEYTDSLLREMKFSRPRLPGGATVAHLAFYLARYMGCDPIMFVGQDLGFSDGLCYAPGTSYDEVWRPELSRFCTLEMKQWQQIVRERPILRRISDVHGNPMYTEERLFGYLQQFERDFSATTQRVLDCTEGGALKRGATPMPLAEALATYCTKPIDRPPPDARPPEWKMLPEILRCFQNRQDEATRVAEIARETYPLLQEIHDHLSDQPKVNRAIAKIDLLRAKMNEYGATYDLVTQLTQRSELDRFEADLKILAEKKLDPHERQKRQVLRDIANCKAIEHAAKEFALLMSVVIGEVKQKQGGLK